MKVIFKILISKSLLFKSFCLPQSDKSCFKSPCFIRYMKICTSVIQDKVTFQSFINFMTRGDMTPLNRSPPPECHFPVAAPAQQGRAWCWAHTTPSAAVWGRQSVILIFCNPRTCQNIHIHTHISQLFYFALSY